MPYGNTLTQTNYNVRIHSVGRHTIVHVLMACAVLEGGEDHHILAEGTPTRAQ